MTETILQRIAAAVGRRPQHPAVVYVREHDEDEVLTYGGLADRAAAIAARLRETCEPGDRALLMYPSGTEFVAAFLGCLLARVIAVPAPLPGHFQYQRTRISAIAQDAGARVALTSAGGVTDVGQWAAADGGRVAVHATDAWCGAGDWELPDGVEGADVALLQFTSGSTGDPKGVVVTHANLSHNTACIERVYGLTSQTPVGGWIPLYHDMGLMGQLLPALVLGATAVLLSPTAFAKRPRMWLQTISRHRVHYSASPDFGYELCLDRMTDADVATLDLSCWKVAANGSEPVIASTLRAFTERFSPVGFDGAAFTPSYGMAEATVYVSGEPDPRPLTRSVSGAALEAGRLVAASGDDDATEVVNCGRPDDFTCRVVDPVTLRVLPEGEVGEIWLAGPSVGAGYWGRPDATAEQFEAHTAEGEGPFLRTGDLGALVDGGLYVTGRAKEVVIIHGRNIYPQDVEHSIRAELRELASLSGAAFAVADDAGRDAMVVLHEVRGRRDGEALRSLMMSIQQLVARDFGVVPSEVHLLRPGAVRKSTSGKVQRTTMRELHLAQELAPVASWSRPVGATR